jgi:hypothetical protein
MAGQALDRVDGVDGGRRAMTHIERLSAMSKHDEAVSTCHTTLRAKTAVIPRRINVAVTPDTVAAIDHLVEREGITVTEAVRRLVNYGEFLYRATKEESLRVVVQDTEGHARELIMI